MRRIDCGFDACACACRQAPLPPLSRGLPYIGDTLKFLQGVNVGRRHHARLGNIYRYVCDLLLGFSAWKAPNIDLVIYDRAWLLGEQVIHVGDFESAKQVLNAEHDLVEGEQL